MKISEMIDALYKQMARRGDIEVRMFEHCDYCGNSELYKFDVIDIDEDGWMMVYE